jgi:Bifunctional DNA primase/polymerase, N-terminal
MTSPTFRHALAYAARGWPVFPCQAGRKTPATAHGHLDATTDPEQITAWYDRHPNWNLAIATGAPDPTSWTWTTTARPATATPPSPD